MAEATSAETVVVIIQGDEVQAVVEMEGEKEIDEACVQTTAMTRDGLLRSEQIAEYTEREIVSSTIGLLNENRLQTDVSPPPISISKDLDSNWVASMRRKLEDEPGRIKAWAARNTCSIHRVPKILRQHDEEAYEPQLISIGPFHYDKRSTHLAAMEEHKWRYLNAILTRNRENRENDGFERCLSAVKALEQEARECYSEEIGLDSNSFVEMMVLDGCFLIEFFGRWMNDEHEDDPLLKLGWIDNTLSLDLFLLENQIPFLVLIPLLTLMNISSDTFISDALDVCTCKLLSLWSKRLNDTNIKEHVKSKFRSGHIHHLLHLLHSIVLPQTRNGKAEKGSRIEMIPCASRLRKAGIKFKNRIVLPQTRNTKAEEGSNEKAEEERIDMIPCASQLQEAGIKFKKSDACSFLHIEFQNGLLEIPPLKIGDDTNCLFRNLIAFEQCHPHCNSYFTTYVTFIDCIINSAKDVEILIHNGIIDNLLGSDEDIAVIFNNMGNGLIFSTQNFYLGQMFNGINRYYETRWHRWRASLMRNYFNNPWVIISLIAAAILLLLTSTQTFFASFPTFAYGN